MATSVCASLVLAVAAWGAEPGHGGHTADAAQGAMEHAAAAAESPGAHGEAGHGGEHEQPGLLDVDLGSAVWTIVLFLVLLTILGKFAWPPILQGLKDREEKIRSDLEGAEVAARQAQQTLREYQQKLAAAQDEAKKVFDQSRADAQKLGEQLKRQAQEEIDALRVRSKEEIGAAKEQAVRELYSEAAELATAVAGKILGREIEEKDDQRLVDESLAELGRAQG